MVGTIAIYDASGERLHTNYIAAAPEHGKATFLQRMDEDIERIKTKYGGVRYVGISDGAADYLPWLKQHTSTQVLDFWHIGGKGNQLVSPTVVRIQIETRHRVLQIGVERQSIRIAVELQNTRKHPIATVSPASR